MFYEVLAWFLLISGVILGVIGTIVPGLPGAVFIFLGALFYKLMIPETFSWSIVISLFILSILSWLADLLAGLWGAKLGGATKYGVMGAGIGGLLGFVIGPAGLILGPFFGAIIGDIYAHKTELKELLSSGLGAAFGFIFSFVSRIILLTIMILTLFIAILF